MESNLGLVNVTWVRERLGDSRLCIIDVRILMEDFQVGYPYGHIPGAVPLDLGELMATIDDVPGRLVQQSQVEQVLGQVGLERDQVALIYDEGSGPLAAQLAWILAYCGHPEIRVLNGGLPAWECTGAPVSNETVQPEPTTYFAELDSSQLATANWIAARLGSPELVLVDARTTREYEIGRLPRAINVPYEETLSGEDVPEFKPAAELEEVFEKVGARPEKEIVLYCQTGARSAHTYLALRSLGYPRVRNYEGSWAEWSRRLDLPVEGEREPAGAVACAPPPSCSPGGRAATSSNGKGLSQQEILRYSRHLLMPEVGLEGQKKLKRASVLVIGAGGLGSPVALYLAAAGVGRIGVVDYDVVDFTNLQRQIIHGSATVGARKVRSARDRLLDLNPDIQLDTYDEPFTTDTALRIVEPYDIIIDGTDNFPTRYLVNDVCVMTGKPNVYGSIFRFDGQLSVFWAERGPCYRCRFPEPPPPGMVPSCAEGGVFGVLPGTIGTLQATEAIKLIVGIGEPMIGKMLLYDALAMTYETIRLKKNPDCRVCSEHPEVTALIDYEEFCGVPGHDRSEAGLSAEWEIAPIELAHRLQDGERIRLIDVREPHELEISRIEGADSIPLGCLAEHMNELDSAQQIVLFCKSGVRSACALEILGGAGFRKLKNLRGGLNAWAQEVDPSQPVY